MMRGPRINTSIEAHVRSGHSNDLISPFTQRGAARTRFKRVRSALLPRIVHRPPSFPYLFCVTEPVNDPGPAAAPRSPMVISIAPPRKVEGRKSHRSESLDCSRKEQVFVQPSDACKIITFPVHVERSERFFCRESEFCSSAETHFHSFTLKPYGNGFNRTRHTFYICGADR